MTNHLNIWAYGVTFLFKPPQNPTFQNKCVVIGTLLHLGWGGAFWVTLENHLTAYDKVEDVEDSGLHCSHKHMPVLLPSDPLSSHHGIYVLSAMLHKQSTKCWASRPVLGKSWLRVTFQGFQNVLQHILLICRYKGSWKLSFSSYLSPFIFYLFEYSKRIRNI